MNKENKITKEREEVKYENKKAKKHKQKNLKK